jgi:hypothetical protein
MTYPAVLDENGLSIPTRLELYNNTLEKLRIIFGSDIQAIKDVIAIKEEINYTKTEQFVLLLADIQLKLYNDILNGYNAQNILDTGAVITPSNVSEFGYFVSTYDEVYNEISESYKNIYGVDVDLNPNTPDVFILILVKWIMDLNILLQDLIHASFILSS